ncbi:hypothetical protein B5X24_HaOG214841 [Helicoverpa armigera]|nr:hypothetical protein B5X24_HaOG214841 [Helicoverpa armigera]
MTRKEVSHFVVANNKFSKLSSKRQSKQKHGGHPSRVKLLAGPAVSPERRRELTRLATFIREQTTTICGLTLLMNDVPSSMQIVILNSSTPTQSYYFFISKGWRNSINAPGSRESQNK